MKKYVFLIVFIFISCGDKSTSIKNDLKNAFLSGCLYNNNIEYCECVYNSLDIGEDGFLGTFNNLEKDFLNDLNEMFNNCKEES